LYPIAGSEKYQLGAPLFRKAEVKLNDKRLVVIAENYDPKHQYVEKILLNGVPITRHWILHKEVENGGILQFWMSPKPNSPKSR
jgi:putative alpha-1,2-mannosidase